MNRNVTPRQVIITIALAAAAVGVAILLMTLPSCDEKDAIEELAPAIGQLAVQAFADTRSDPDVLAAYTRDGWDGVRETAPRVYLTHIKNAALDYGASSDKLERAAYELIRDESPLVAAMVRRDTALGPQGIWPRLDALAKSHGYPGASLSLLAELTPEQIDWLMQRAPLVIAEEYEAAKAHLDTTGTSSAPADEDWLQ